MLQQVRNLIRRAQVPPYDVARRRGEIRYVVVTAAPDGSTMVQLVLRSEQALGRIREHLTRLLGPAPLVTSVWANIHPDHTTAITGPTDIHLAGERTLPITTGEATLHAGPRSFVQTNTAVAGELYRQAGRWIAAWAPRTVWDLYCGLGGFALHAALACTDTPTSDVHSRGPRACDTRAGVPVGHDPQHPLPLITGVETRADAVEGARRSAQDAGLGERLRFLCADATTWAQRTAQADGPPDVLVVNPPRRGLGARPRRLDRDQRRCAPGLFLLPTGDPCPRPGGHAVTADHRRAVRRHVPAHRARRGSGAARAARPGMMRRPRRSTTQRGRPSRLSPAQHPR